MGEYCLASSGMAVEDCRPMRHLALGLALFAGMADAQIVGNGLGTSVSAPTGAVTISGGTSVGTNVFHSFGTFNVATGDSATFSGAGTVTNIIARVTGGASFIDGTLKTAAGANTSLWLLNPAGVAFGPNASLDIAGSFHASTAHALRFGAGGDFDMAGAPAGTLTVSPTAFVFLAPPAAISVNGSQLSVAAGNQLSLVGGDIAISNGATLRAAAGQLSLAGVRSAGSIDAATLAATSVSAYGDITVANSSANTWSTPGAPGPTSGAIIIRGGKLTVAQSTLSTEHTGGTAGGNIDVALAGDLAMNGGLMLATGLGTGAAGDVTVNAAGVSMANGSVIDTSGLDIGAFAGGQSGTTTLNAAGDVSISGGSQVTSVTMTGTGGDVNVTAGGNLNVSGAASMINVVTVGSGTGGNIAVNASNVGLSGGGRISAGNEIAGAIGPSNGNGGNITVNAAAGVAIAGGGIFSSNPAFGNAGTISVTAGSAITLAAGGQISSSAQVGSGGQITLLANDLVSLSNSRITTSVADGSGNGGSIFIDPAFVTLSASQIVADTFNGLGGQIDVITGNLVMDASSFIRAEALGPFGVPGTVQVSAPNVDAGSALGVLAAAYVDPSALLRESCAARGARAGSSFTGAGRGALPAGPDSAGFARYALGTAPAVQAAAALRTASRTASVLQGCSG
jgi:filamentous hemagglutinin family protein